MLERNRNLVEGFKSMVIFLLAVSAVYLAGKAFVPYAGSRGETVRNPALIADEEPMAGVGVAHPVRMAVVNASGRYAAQYDDAAVDGAFDQLGDLLSEALGSAGDPVAVEREMWEHALGCTGVYYDFPGVISLRLLSAWLGEEEVETDVWVTCLLLAETENGASPRLYYVDAETENYYACDTTVQFRQRLEGFVPNGAFFAFQQPEHYGQLDPDTLILPSTPTPPIYKSGTGINIQDNETLESLLNSLSFSPQPNAVYPASDGWNVREAEDSLRLSKNGNIYYHAGENSDRYPVAYGADGAGVVEATGELVRQVVTARSGAARVYLDEIEKQADGWRVTYRYSLSGADVQLGEDGWCASFTVTGGQISEYVLKVRRYEATEETAVLLPEYQAMHAMKALDAEERRLLLRYSDSGSGVASPYWIAR